MMRCAASWLLALRNTSRDALHGLFFGLFCFYFLVHFTFRFGRQRHLATFHLGI